MRNPLKGSSLLYLKHGIILKIPPQKSSGFFSSSSCCSRLHLSTHSKVCVQSHPGSLGLTADGSLRFQLRHLVHPHCQAQSQVETTFINPEKGNLFDSSKTLQQHTHTAKQPLKGSNLCRPWGSTTSQLPFSCDKNRKQLLLAALKRGRRRWRRNSGSDCEPSRC